MGADRGSYALITPARNEAGYLPAVMDAMAAQTHPPALWVVVDDGSTDNTAELVEARQKQLPYLRLVRRADRGFDAVGDGVVATFNSGLPEVLEAGTRYLGKLDGDIVVDPDYFERLVARMDAEPNLGIASGQNYLVKDDGTRVVERHRPWHPVGGARLYRREVFDAIDGLVESPGWDTLDIVRARMLGYDTRTDDDLAVIHVRPMGTRSALRDGVHRRGRSSYLLGYSHLYFAARLAYFAAVKEPRPQHAWWLLQGYLRAIRKAEPRIATARERRWLRSFQRKELLRAVRPPSR